MLKLHLLSDGYVDIKQRALFGEHVPDVKIRLPIHGYLIETEDRLILIDSGCGTYFGPTAGKLKESLNKVGFECGEITDLLFTHLHPDHIGGVSHFKNATIYFSQREFDYWLSDTTVLSNYNQKYLTFVQNSLGHLKDRIVCFKEGEILFSLIETILAPGHTPGHTAFFFNLENEKVLVWGDVMHSIDLQLQHLELTTNADDDPKTAIVTRKMLLEKAINNHLLVCGAHLPNQGAGYFESADGSLCWRSI